MLVLEGPQGCGKSTLVAKLAVRPEWLMDGLELDADNKAVMELLAGRLIVEIPELAGIREAAVEKVKAMLSRTHDRARLPYAQLATQQPRTCVLIGTTNSIESLRDLTGNRRFWPVTVGEIDLDALERDRDQLWAEAVAMEARGEPLTLPRHLRKEAAGRAEERLALDPWEEMLSEELDGRWGKARADALWGILGADTARRGQELNNRLGGVMRRLGWTRARARWDGKQVYLYRTGEGATDALPKVEFGCDRERL